MPASDELSQLRAQLHSETGATFPRADDAHFDELHGLRARLASGIDAPQAELVPAWARFFKALGPATGRASKTACCSACACWKR